LASASDIDFESFLRLREENIVRVDQPLALICQAQRSGGTLLNTLFDGHPQCHVHPHELRIGDRAAHTWPRLKPTDGAETWFSKLQEEQLGILYVKGRRKVPLKAQGDKSKAMGSYPFILPPAFLRRLFMDEVARRNPESERDVLNCYLTALFNAWVDNQNLVGPEKRWVVTFSPRRAWGEGLRRFFKLYPDGRLISILRDPWSWYTSAQGRDPDADPEDLLAAWNRSSTEMLTAARRYPDRVMIVRFEELLLDTETAMRRLAGFLEIAFDPQLLVPTFNRYPVGANSSYEVRDIGVVAEPTTRFEQLLSREQREMIATECEERYWQVLAFTSAPPPRVAVA
jgi:Sulfotransferase family